MKNIKRVRARSGKGARNKPKYDIFIVYARYSVDEKCSERNGKRERRTKKYESIEASRVSQQQQSPKVAMGPCAKPSARKLFVHSAGPGKSRTSVLLTAVSARGAGELLPGFPAIIPRSMQGNTWGKSGQNTVLYETELIRGRTIPLPPRLAGPGIPCSWCFCQGTASPEKGVEDDELVAP